MIWSDKRDHMVGYMTPLLGIPSSLVVEARGSLEWFSVPRPDGSVMLYKIEEQKQKNMNAQRTSREAQNG